MLISIDAVVIREKRLAQQDRLLTLLTSDKGVITAYAKGASSLKRSMVSCTELLCHSKFKLFLNKEKCYVDNAESNTVFFTIRQDLEKVSLATYFCQICGELIPPGDCNQGYYKLLLNSLYLLEKDKLPNTFVKSIFELRTLTMAGYMPDLVACSSCGSYEGQLYFSPISGVLFCSECKPTLDHSLIPISLGVLQAMRHIIYTDFNKLFRFRISEESMAELDRLSRAYMIAQVEKMLPALTFYESMCIF